MIDKSIPEAYVRARRGLLDVMSVLEAHRHAIVLVGAQAVYLHTGSGELAVQASTTDADIALSPRELSDEPLVEKALREAGFTPRTNPGTWQSVGGVPIDIMVPEAIAGAGRRAARIPPYGKEVARKTPGLEPALIDNSVHELSAFESGDSRTVHIKVAGPAALLVAKIFKVHERQSHPHRLQPKDGLDIFRLLSAVDPALVSQKLSQLTEDPTCREVVQSAIQHLQNAGRGPDGTIARLAKRAIGELADPEFIANATAEFIDEVLQGLPKDRELTS